MNKTKVTRVIQKYSLAGLVESVAWKAGDNKLITRFISDDKTVLGEIESPISSFLRISYLLLILPIEATRYDCLLARSKDVSHLLLVPFQLFRMIFYAEVVGWTG